MKPQREDIAAPELPPRLQWIGAGPDSMAALTATGSVLVHFIDFAQLNSVRTLPYITEWNQRYGGRGLTVLGVQSPRLPFGSDRDAVTRGLERLGIDFSVALDEKRDLWLDYGCEGWPSLFLWGRGGALRWFHFGEGEYLATEEAIQKELRSEDALADLPPPMKPLRPSDAPGATVIGPTPEIFPAEDRAWTREADGPAIATTYEAGGAFVTLEGEGELAFCLDGGRPERRQIVGAGLYRLTEHDRHERHEIEVELGAGLSLWSLSFPPAVAAENDG